MAIDSLTAMGNRHNFNQPSYTNEFSGNQTALAIITPTTGKKISVKGIYVGTNATTGKARIYFATSANTAATIYAADGGSYVPLFAEGAVNEALTLTTTFGEPTFILVNYSEN